MRNQLEWEQVRTDLESQVKGILPEVNGGTGNGSGSLPPAPISLVAGENISSYHAVVCINGLAYNADASTPSHAGKVIGVAINSALQNDAVNIQASGETDNLGFLFTAGQPVYLGNGGGLVQTTQTGTAFQQQIGVALSASRLLIALDEVILYA